MRVNRKKYEMAVDNSNETRKRKMPERRKSFVLYCYFGSRALYACARIDILYAK